MLLFLLSWAYAGPGDLAVEKARTWMGTDFRWNGRGTESHPGMDCLGLVFRAWGEVTGTGWRSYEVNPSELVAGKKLGSVVVGLQGVDREGLDMALLRPGDIVYLLLAEVPIPDEPLWVTLEGRYWPWHVAMYTAEGRVIHAGPGQGVVEAPLVELSWDRLVVTRR